MKSIKEKYRQFLNTDRGADSYNQFKRLLYTEEDSLVQTLNNNVLQHLPIVQKEKLKICDIGGGDGDRITRILSYLNAKFKIRFKLDFVEQSKQYIDAFDAAKINEFAKTRKIHGLFENADLQPSYDLVFLIHSIFAFSIGKAAEQILSITNQDGKIVVVSNSSKSFLGGLKVLVDEEYDDRRYEIDDLQKDLRKNNISFTPLSFETKWAIGMKNYEEHLKTILEWITLDEFEALSQIKKKEVFEYIKGKTIERDNRIFFVEDEVVLVIPALVSQKEKSGKVIEDILVSKTTEQSRN